MPGTKNTRSKHTGMVTLSFAFSSGEREALKTEAKRLGITQAELFRGVLTGHYSVKDILEGTRTNDLVISSLWISEEDKNTLRDLAAENFCRMSDIIRGTLYETM